jgi:hypothetical protein
MSSFYQMKTTIETEGLLQALARNQSYPMQTFCCSQTGLKAAPMLFTKPALSMEMSHTKKCATLCMPILYQQSKTPILPEATQSMCVLVV